VAAAHDVWHLVAVRRFVLLVALAACRDRGSTTADVVDRSWRAHELVIAAGERAPTCAAAGAAMQRVFTEHRQAFVDGLALDKDRRRLEEATDYIASHEQRYGDLDTRMQGLAERCATDETVMAVFRWMESP
jgi:hypothetical protein